MKRLTLQDLADQLRAENPDSIISIEDGYVTTQHPDGALWADWPDGRFEKLNDA